MRFAGNCFALLWERLLVLLGRARGMTFTTHGMSVFANGWTRTVSNSGHGNLVFKHLDFGNSMVLFGEEKCWVEQTVAWNVTN